MAVKTLIDHSSLSGLALREGAGLELVRQSTVGSTTIFPHDNGVAENVSPIVSLNHAKGVVMALCQMRLRRARRAPSRPW